MIFESMCVLFECEMSMTVQSITHIYQSKKFKRFYRIFCVYLDKKLLEILFEPEFSSIFLSYLIFYQKTAVPLLFIKLFIK